MGLCRGSKSQVATSKLTEEGPRSTMSRTRIEEEAPCEFVFSMMLVFDSKPGFGECAINIIAGVRTAYVAVVTREMRWNFSLF